MTSHRIRLCVALAAAVAGAACGSSSSPTGSEAAPIPPGAVLLDLRPLDAELGGFRIYSGVASPRRAVIDSESEWAAAWAEITRNVQPRPALPTVSFSRDVVLLAASGSRATGGYGIEIEAVYQDDGDVVARVVESAPGSRCFLTQAFTAPLDAVVVPRSALRVRWEELDRVRECD
jgi:hypothetical protein